MNQSQKLNLFVGMGCKRMKDVWLHHTNWMIEIGSSNHMLKGTENDNPYIYIEAIPEKLNVDEQHKNAYDLWRRYRSILLEMKA